MIVHKLIKRKMKTIFEHNLIDSTIASVVCILNGRNEKSKKISLERFDNIVSKPLFILFRHEEYRVSCCSIKAMLFFSSQIRPLLSFFFVLMIHIEHETRFEYSRHRGRASVSKVEDIHSLL